MLRISTYQLFTLTVLFEIGSTTLFALGIGAKQDAWIAILLAMLIGFFLIWVYTELQRNFPEKNFAEIILILLGKWLGGPLVFLYGLFFIYISTRNFRDFGELILITALPETPLLVILILFMLTGIYILFLGLEVLARTSEVMLPVVLFFIISTYVLITLSGQVNLKELMPVLGNGMGPVLKEVYPNLVNFPFGEILVFSMFWPFADSQKAVRKTALLAVGISGVLLSVSLIIIISALGVDYAAIATIPFLEVIKLIEVGDILTHLDAIGIIIMFIGGFYKMSLFFYGAILSFTALFRIKDPRWMIIPLGVFILWLSIVFEPNYPFHLWLGLEVSLKYIHSTFQIFIPALLLIIGWLKMKYKKNTE
ncbi:GerAB/ArcD/ProY family transporter [Geosporobacter ferrireducens]|uniref:Uncharacterized protein n=1 Tax=Geosporobacter ferrireducens TaxID=1424294 RepID=A0A1D8GFE8_9FIRM|nr:GerAB/ArcD/ProY family transporter [Geosporobacter ferrireducens]AOT69630.1 hypothetical protein Gferi_08595 [Geosporobacter ferrireducens]